MANVSVTTKGRSRTDGNSRNEILEAELVEHAERAAERFRNYDAAMRELVASFGTTTPEEASAKAATSFLRESSFLCAECKQEFAEGDTVYRCKGRFIRRFESYCLECVGRWHPSWLKAADRNPPQPCAGGCGALVTSPYTLVHSWEHGPRGTVEHWTTRVRTCSRRCTRLARNARRSPKGLRICVVCDEEFLPKRKDALYCSNACRQDAYRQRKAGRL